MKTDRKLESQIKRYMKQNNIPTVKINGKETLVLEPISHGERAVWIGEWLIGNVTTKQLLKRMENYLQHRFQWCQMSTSDFLRAVKGTEKQQKP